MINQYKNNKKKKVAMMLLGGILAGAILTAMMLLVFNWQMALAATYNWVQSIPALGGQGWVTVTGTNASHLANQTNWNYFSAKDANVSTSISDDAVGSASPQGYVTLGCKGGPVKVTDVEGNIYNTVQIGTQCWMKENMRTTKYPNNSSITRGPTTSWNSSDLGYYGCPPNTGNTAEDCAAFSTLGYMYQWSAAMNSTTTEGAQGICPAGWHIPTDAQQYTLESYLATGSCVAGRAASWTVDACDPAGTKLKSGGTSGFEGLLAGYRTTASPWFTNRAASTYFWSSTQSSTNAWDRVLGTSDSTVYRGAHSKAYGFSVRCLKD